MGDDPTEILSTEHRIVRSAIALLLAMARAAERGRTLPLDGIRELVGFFRHYADDLHHAKEEELVFTALAEIGLPLGAGPIGTARHDHATARTLLGVLEQRVAERFDPSAFARDARRYATQMRANIEHEERAVFPLVRVALPESVRRRVVGQMQRERVAHAAEQERCLAILESLVGTIGPCRFTRTA